MLYRIAELKTLVPPTGNMAKRCEDYRIDGDDTEAQIIIDDTRYRYELMPRLSEDLAAYMESGMQYYLKLLDFDGLMLHASATVIDGEAYLFAGQCGIGKSTHARLLMSRYPDAQLINDDKPALRCVGGTWYAYGTPWCGKNFINVNARYPLKAICLLTARRDRNDIRRAEPIKAVSGLISCSVGRGSRRNLLKLSPLLDRLIRDIPIYEMDSLANDETARLAVETMRNGGTQ